MGGGRQRAGDTRSLLAAWPEGGAAGGMDCRSAPLLARAPRGFGAGPPPGGGRDLVRSVRGLFAPARPEEGGERGERAPRGPGEAAERAAEGAAEGAARH